MSSFTVLIFNNKKERAEVTKIANTLGIDLYEKMDYIDPCIEELHLLIHEDIISSLNHYYGEGCRTLEEVRLYKKETLRSEIAAIKQLKSSQGYERKVTDFLSKQQLLNDRMRQISGDVQNNEDLERMLNSEEYQKVQAEISRLYSQLEPHFLTSIDYDFEYWQRDLKENTLEYLSSDYSRIKRFIEKVVEVNNSCAFLSHFSDHSEKEIVPINETKEVALVQMTIETLVFLPYNTLLRII